MARYFLLTLFLIFYLITNNCLLGQNWVGTYKWTSMCSQSECCCFANELTVTKVPDNNNKLSFISGRAGAVCTTTKYENVIDDPKGRSFMDSTGSRTLIWVINQNSTAISAVDYQYTNCTSEALLNSSKKNSHYNLYLIMIVNFITVIKWFYVQQQNL